MRFYNYLNESNGLNMKAFEKMVADCKPFLGELKKSNYEFLYSGREGSYEKFNKRKIRKRRKPRDTPPEIHDMLNKSFKDKFGVKARSESLFITNNPHEAASYGQPHYVFPVGKYKLIYSKKVNDLYRYLDNMILHTFGEPMSYYINVFDGSDKAEIGGYTETEWKNEVQKIIDDIVSTYKQSKKIPTELPPGFEIMLISDEARLQRWSYKDKNDVEPLLKEWIENAI